MVRFVFCLRRLPQLSREEFLDYWLNKHAPLVLSFKDRLHMDRYVQLHTVSTPLDAMFLEESGGHEPFDGISESWWESPEAFQKSLVDPEAQEIFAALRKDELNFIDQKNSIMWFGKEHDIL